MTYADDRYSQARRLLAAGHTPGQVAMQTGLPLAAVDRLAGLPTTAERLTGTACAPSGGQYGAGWVVSYPERPEAAVRCGWGLGCARPVMAGGMCAAHEGARPAKGPLPLFALGGRKRRAA